MNAMVSYVTRLVFLSGAALLCSAPLAGCAAREAAAPRLSARDHEALAASGANDQAEAHRVAAQELRTAEESACAGISEADRNRGPFTSAEQVVQVEPLTQQVRVGKQVYPSVVGSKITMIAAPGVTKQWITRLAECHAARHALLGTELAEATPCPLATGPVAISVEDAPTSFVVSVRSAAGDRGAEHVLRQSLALLHAPDQRSAQVQPSGQL